MVKPGKVSQTILSGHLKCQWSPGTAWRNKMLSKGRIFCGLVRQFSTTECHTLRDIFRQKDVSPTDIFLTRTSPSQTSVVFNIPLRNGISNLIFIFFKLFSYFLWRNSSPGKITHRKTPIFAQLVKIKKFVKGKS